MNTPNSSDNHPTATNTRPVALVRYRPGLTGETARMVHLIPLPNSDQQGTAHALCGALLPTTDIETVTPGHGMPCNSCLVSHVAHSPPHPTVEPSHTAYHAVAADYQEWGWPVTLRRDQVWLNLEPDTVALIIPIPIATKVATILTARHCLPPVLAHPYAPEHRVLLAGEPYPVALPWPPGIDRITTTLLLPPTHTPRGPLRWVHPPCENSLQQCREIDILAATRTALQRPD